MKLLKIDTFFARSGLIDNKFLKAFARVQTNSQRQFQSLSLSLSRSLSPRKRLQSIVFASRRHSLEVGGAKKLSFEGRAIILLSLAPSTMEVGGR